MTDGPPLPGAKGTCFSVELDLRVAVAPVDRSGVYCYADDGLLTAARVGFGMLAPLVSAAAAPPTAP